MSTVVVTRHASLVQYLDEIGLLPTWEWECMSGCGAVSGLTESEARQAGCSLCGDEGHVTHTPEAVQVVGHATTETVRGKHVIGVLPNHLACEALDLTEVPLNLPAELRGVELSVEQIRLYAGKPTTYKITKL